MSTYSKKMVAAEPQLTSAINYNVSNLVFDEPTIGDVSTGGENGPKIQYRRIMIKTKYPDGSYGDLIIPTSEGTDTNFSYGIQENINPDTSKPNGWVFPICLYDRDKPTEFQERWVESFDRIVEACKQHLIDNKEEIDKFDLTMDQLTKLNPLYWKMEVVKDEKTGKKVKRKVPGTGPTLYAKLIHSKKQDKILTQFYNIDTGDNMDPMELLAKYCEARCAIKFESIFVGTKIALQLKLYECDCKLLTSSMPRLLSRPKSDGRVLTKQAYVNSSPLDDDVKLQNDDDTGSLQGDDELDKHDKQDEQQTKKVVKRIVKKTK
jgi:hypothetical protein